jgi:ubiquinone/menaquinone biosynthesis C-methylase UbiE
MKIKSLFSFIKRKSKEIFENEYTLMQKKQYKVGTSNQQEHNSNPDYWDILLKDLKESEKFKNKVGLDFACGKGRNVTNMLKLCDWDRVDGIDLSKGNIEFCKSEYIGQKSNWYMNNGVDVSQLKNDEYDFVMSTIALQHIPVYDIRRSLLVDIFRVLKKGGTFSFQMGFGEGLDTPLGKRVKYFENFYSAKATNSACDVRVQSENEIIDDLMSIGYKNIETVVRDSFSDKGHPFWIYVSCSK